MYPLRPAPPDFDELEVVLRTPSLIGRWRARLWTAWNVWCLWSPVSRTYAWQRVKRQLQSY